MTALAFLALGSIFIDIEKIDAAVAFAAGTMFRKAHETSNTGDTNKKHLRWSMKVIDVEPIGAGEIRIRKIS